MSNEQDPSDADLESRLRHEADRIWEVRPCRPPTDRLLATRRRRLSRSRRTMLSAGLMAILLGLSSVFAMCLWSTWRVAPNLHDPQHPMNLSGRPLPGENREPIAEHGLTGNPAQPSRSLTVGSSAGTAKAGSPGKTPVLAVPSGSLESEPSARFIFTSDGAGGDSASATSTMRVVPSTISSQRESNVGGTVVVPYSPSAPTGSKRSKGLTIQVKNPSLDGKRDPRPPIELRSGEPVEQVDQPKKRPDPSLRSG